MKNAIKILFIGLFFFNLSLFAQDLQEVYAEAKSALLEGNVEKALLQISVAHAMIDEDPNIDPNGNFKNKLLPKLEDTANNMNAAIKALEELKCPLSTMCFIVWSSYTIANESPALVIALNNIPVLSFIVP